MSEGSNPSTPTPQVELPAELAGDLPPELSDGAFPADDPLLDGLTEPQREAVSHVDGPLLVLAGRELVGMVGPTEIRRTLQLMAAGSRSPRSAPGDKKVII